MFKSLREWWYRTEFEFICILSGEPYQETPYLSTCYCYWCYYNQYTRQFLVDTSYGWEIRGYLPKKYAVPTREFFKHFLFKKEYHEN